MLRLSCAGSPCGGCAVHVSYVGPFSRPLIRTSNPALRICYDFLASSRIPGQVHIIGAASAHDTRGGMAVGLARGAGGGGGLWAAYVPVRAGSIPHACLVR